MFPRTFWPAVAIVTLIVAAVPSIPRITAAEMPVGAPATTLQSNDPATYIVVQTDEPLALYRGGIPGLAPTSPEVLGQVTLDPTSADSQAYLAYLDAQRSDLLSRMQAALGRSVTPTFTYSYALAGMAVTLTPSEAAIVSGLAGVRFAQPDERLELLTDNGPTWIGADDVWNGTASTATKGEGIVVGIIDTGINNDHPSFADVGGDGFDHTNPRGRHFGICAPLNPVICNDKLIGIYDFTGTSGGFDDNGHGSHTASTVAGNVIPNAVLNAPTISLTRSISGVAPHANIIAYKACDGIAGACLATATVASIDQATRDQVDVVNFSIGGGSTNPWTNALALSFLGARAGGVFIAASAGNNGPNSSTHGQPANSPWALAVGASTHDRRPTGRVTATKAGGASVTFTGMTVASGIGPLALVDARALGNDLCNPFTATQAASVVGKIVVCTQGTIGRVAKGQNVKNAGGKGMVLVSQPGAKASVVADTHVLPAVMISEWDGDALRAWLVGAIAPEATIEGTTIDVSPQLADRMAYFSSRGPDASVPNVIKPDVTAPGVAVFAAWIGANALPGGTTPEYNVIQGTSMSAPHAAGAAALVRAVNRGWTPDQVKSALMSTGVTAGVTKEDHSTPGDPHDLGGGRIDLTRAVRAGLTLSETAAAYQAANPLFAGAAGARALNLASAANDDCRVICSWTRTLTSTASGSVSWTATTSSSSLFGLTVSPASFTLAPGASQVITITATDAGLAPNFWEFGAVTLAASDASLPTQQIPVAIRMRGAAPPQACVIPSETVTTDPQGDVQPSTDPIGAQVALTPGHDIREVGVAGLFPTFGGRSIPNITFRMKVESLEIVPPEAFWWVTFVPPGAGANVNYFVAMWSGPTGQTSFTYGTVNFVAQTFSTLGAPEEGKFSRDGTITITIAASRVLDPKVGSTLSSITGYSGPAHANLVTFETEWTQPGTYVLGGCRNAELSVSANDITTAGEKEATTISAVVRNTGKSDVAGVPVAFSVNGAPLGDVLVDIPAGGAATATIGWNTKGLKGDFVIRVDVDPLDAVPERNESDNTATKLVTIRGNRAQ